MTLAGEVDLDLCSSRGRRKQEELLTGYAPLAHLSLSFTGRHVANTPQRFLEHDDLTQPLLIRTHHHGNQEVQPDRQKMRTNNKSQRRGSFLLKYHFWYLCKYFMITSSSGLVWKDLIGLEGSGLSGRF